MVLAFRRLFGPLSPEQVESIQNLVAERDEALARARRAEAQVEARGIAKRRSPPIYTFRVRRWEEMEVEFHPRAEPYPITRPAIRVYLPPGDLYEGRPYMDFTSKRVLAALRVILPKIEGTDTTVEIIQDGEGPTSRYRLSVIPPKSP